MFERSIIKISSYVAFSAINMKHRIDDGEILRTVTFNLRLATFERLEGALEFNVLHSHSTIRSLPFDCVGWNGLLDPRLHRFEKWNVTRI